MTAQAFRITYMDTLIMRGCSMAFTAIRHVLVLCFMTLRAIYLRVLARRLHQFGVDLSVARAAG